MVCPSSQESSLPTIGGVGEREQQEDHCAEADGGPECSRLHGCEIKGRGPSEKELLLGSLSSFQTSRPDPRLLDLLPSF